MEIINDPVEGIFLRRVNRFLGEVLVEDKAHQAHLPNSGRLEGLLKEGRKVFLRKCASKGRKTKFDIVTIEVEGRYVCIDARIPNLLLLEEIRSGGALSYFAHYEIISEVRWRGRRFDFAFRKGDDEWIAEVKSVTLLKDGCGLFPDAPTLRGREHVKLLRGAVLEGRGGLIVFVIQRDDASCFMPNWEMDYDFSRALKEAAEAGVWVRALRCAVGPANIQVEDEVPVVL